MHKCVYWTDSQVKDVAHGSLVFSFHLPLSICFSVHAGIHLSLWFSNEISRSSKTTCNLIDKKPNSSFQPVSDEIAIMRQFTFASSLQRMSVITRKLGAPNFELFSKGAPEMIASLSKPETGKRVHHLIEYCRYFFSIYPVNTLWWNWIPFYFQCQVIFMRFWLNILNMGTEYLPLLTDHFLPNWSMQKYKEFRGRFLKYYICSSIFC